MLPRFLLADNSQELPDTVFVVHNETPRFIVESNIEDFDQDQSIHWIDEEPDNANEVKQLLKLAEAFIEDELANQEDLFDDDLD